MKLSTKTRYGLRALLYMAERYDGERTVPLGEIAKEQQVSEKYLEQLFIKLRRKEIIQGVRGAQEGTSCRGTQGCHGGLGSTGP